MSQLLCSTNAMPCSGSQALRPYLNLLVMSGCWETASQRDLPSDDEDTNWKAVAIERLQPVRLTSVLILKTRSQL